MTVALNAWDCFHRIGPAEGERAIAQAVLYLASAPKSNAVYTAFKQARELARHSGHEPVPNHLRNAPTQLMKDIGFGQEYRYAHDEPHAYAAGESYLPEGMAEPHWYEPVDRGLESQIAEKMAFLRRLDLESNKK